MSEETAVTMYLDDIKQHSTDCKMKVLQTNGDLKI